MNWVSPASERPFKERGEEGGGGSFLAVPRVSPYFKEGLTNYTRTL